MKIFKALAATATILAMTTLSPVAMAETHYKPHISIGGHAGMAMSRMTFSPTVKQNWLNGMTMGVQVRYSEEKLFGIAAELNFEQRGWRENFEESPLKYSRTLTYISLPIMTQIHFGSRRFKFLVNLGPSFSYMIGESISADFDYHHPLDNPDFPKKSRMTEQLYTKVKNKFDYGITAGLGGEFYVKPRHSVYAEVRFYYGLGNIFPSSKADTFSASRCMSLTATLGYNFRLK